MKVFKKLQQFNEMIIHLVVCRTIIISKNSYKMVAINLSKQQALDANPKAIQQINFTGNLNRGESVNNNTTIFFITEEAKETILDFSQGTLKVL